MMCVVTENMIPKGRTPEDNKVRKQIIGDFYTSWIKNNPEKVVWNNSLNAYIHIKGQSINETKGHASLSYQSTSAVLHLTEILTNATIAEFWAPKHNDKNQKPYSKMILMRWKTYRLIVGFQKSKGEYVQYYVGSI